MTYVPLEEVMKVLSKSPHPTSELEAKKIRAIPTIDFIAIIEEELDKKLDYACNNPFDNIQDQIELLEALIKKLKSF